MRSAVCFLALFVGCAGGTATPEPAAIPEVEMAPAELMVPASQAEMLKEEIAALKAQAVELREALATAEEPDEAMSMQLAVTGANVTALEAELRSMETELIETRARLAESEETNRKLEVALATTTEALTRSNEALEEREEELAEARTALDDARADLSAARKFVEVAGWRELVSQAKIAMCQKGSARAISSCHERAVEVIRPFESVVKACLRSGQAAPTLRSSLADGRIPSHAVRLDDRKADGLYVLLCDPTLPEARALLASMAAEPEPQPDLEDMDEEFVKVSSRSERRESAERTRRERPTRASIERIEPSEAAMFDDEPDELRGMSNDAEGLGFEDLDGSLEDTKQKRRGKKKDEVQRRVRDRDLLDDADDDLSDDL